MSWKIFAKKAVIQTTIFLYSLCNVSIFFHGNNNFVLDMEFGEDASLETLSDLLTWDGGLLAAASLMVLISNQRAFTQNLEDILQERESLVIQVIALFRQIMLSPVPGKKHQL